MIRPTLVYGPTSEQVARALVSAGAYRIASVVSEQNFFTWKSGIRAPVYTDIRTLNSDPGARAVVINSLVSSIRSNFPAANCVVGIAEAGIVVSSTVAHELSLPHAWIRKTEKKHGIKGRVAGYPVAEAKAVIVDDLVASGSSVQDAIVCLEEETRVKAIGIQSVVNWDFTVMRDIFDPLRIPVRALASFPQLLNAAREVGLLTEDAVTELANFYRSPKTHRWDLTTLTGFASDMAKSS